MKLKMIGAGLAACLLVVLTGGCSKEDSSGSTKSMDVQKTASNTVAATEKAVQTATTEVNATADGEKRRATYG